MSLEVKGIKVTSTDATVDVYTILNYEFSKENDEPVLTFIDDNHSKHIIFQRTIKSVEVIREEVPDKVRCTACNNLIMTNLGDPLVSYWTAKCTAGIFELEDKPSNEISICIEKLRNCEKFRGK